MPTTVCRATEITVGLPREQAIALFTPEGERRWADGWDPHYPEPRRREGPGAVFITEHGGHRTTWIMVGQGPEGVSYARVTEAMSAGTVAVDVVATDERSTQVRVTYDLTAITPAGEAWLEAFDAGYEAAIADWATEIAAALRSV
ncbi:MAG: SRPBCC family protein [Solirubrobacteraceae bacterium]